MALWVGCAGPTTSPPVDTGTAGTGPAPTTPAPATTAAGYPYCQPPSYTFAVSGLNGTAPWALDPRDGRVWFAGWGDDLPVTVYDVAGEVVETWQDEGVIAQRDPESGALTAATFTGYWHIDDLDVATDGQTAALGFAKTDAVFGGADLTPVDAMTVAALDGDLALRWSAAIDGPSSSPSDSDVLASRDGGAWVAFRGDGGIATLAAGTADAIEVQTESLGIVIAAFDPAGKPTWSTALPPASSDAFLATSDGGALVVLRPFQAAVIAGVEVPEFACAVVGLAPTGAIAWVHTLTRCPTAAATPTGAELWGDAPDTLDEGGPAPLALGTSATSALWRVRLSPDGAVRDAATSAQANGILTAASGGPAWLHVQRLGNNLLELDQLPITADGAILEVAETGAVTCVWPWLSGGGRFLGGTSTPDRRLAAWDVTGPFTGTAEATPLLLPEDPLTVFAAW